MRQYTWLSSRLVTVIAAEGTTIIGDTGLRTGYARVVAYWTATAAELRERCEKQFIGATHFGDIGEMLAAYGFPAAQRLPRSKIVVPYGAQRGAANRWASWWRQRLYRRLGLCIHDGTR